MSTTETLLPRPPSRWNSPSTSSTNAPASKAPCISISTHFNGRPKGTIHCAQAAPSWWESWGRRRRPHRVRFIIIDGFVQGEISATTKSSSRDGARAGRLRTPAIVKFGAYFGGCSMKHVGSVFCRIASLSSSPAPRGASPGSSSRAPWSPGSSRKPRSAGKALRLILGPLFSGGRLQRHGCAAWRTRDLTGLQCMIVRHKMVP